MHEARKTVTVLFADVVSSTALGESLDVEALRALMSRYFAEMADVVERHGGTVEKFIGDEVMAVFGVPLVHEDDALRAVRAAAAMRARLGVFNVDAEARWGWPLQIRIGVNTGEVVAGDASSGHGFVSGDAVNVAKRIEQAAAPGEILLGDSTYGLVRHAVQATALAELRAKGKRDGVLAHRLESVDLTSEALPRRLDAPLVGRAVELDALRKAFDRAVETGRPRLVTVLGQPGIGKSRLVKELLDDVAPAARVLVGRCVPYGEGITYWPVREILPEESLEGSREEIFWRIRKQLESFARERPLVVCFEDVHWAEPTLLDLVQYLAGWIAEGAVLLVCVARPELLEKRPDWPRTEPEGESVTLGPLDESEAAQLLEHLEAPDSARDRIAEAAEGNPLFVEQMTAMTVDGGAEVTVPPSLHAVLVARLDRLGADEVGVLERAATIGRDFSLQAVLELAPDELRPRASTLLLGLVRKGLIRPHETDGGDGFRFRHALIRDAAYESMPKALRSELHERCASWLGESRGQDVLVGYHLEQSALLRGELGVQDAHSSELAARAATLLHEAGGRAVARGDATAAASLLDRSLALLSPSDVEYPAILVELADACMRLGQFERAGRALDEATAAARAGGDRRTELRAVIGRRILRVFVPWGPAPDEPGDEDLIAELEDLEDDLALARAWRAVSDQHTVTCHWQARADALERALTHARRLPKGMHEAATISILLVQALHVGPAPGSKTARRCRELLATAGGDVPLQAGTKVMLAAVLAAQGRIDDARRTYAESVALHDELGLSHRRAVGTLFGAEIENLAGDPRAAEQELERGYRTLEAMGDTGARAVVAAVLSQTLCAQGRIEEAASYAEIAAEIAEPDDVFAQVLQRATRALTTLAAGDAGAAETLARQAAELADTTDSLALRADAALALADVLAQVGRSDEARDCLVNAAALYEAKENVVAARRVAARLSQLAPEA